MRYYTLYWVTSTGISGSRGVMAADRRAAEALFAAVAPAGSRLLYSQGD